MPVDISTVYLGIPLTGPFIAGASPRGDHLDTVRRLEDAGCAAIVLHSLFEEQISQARSGRIHLMDPLDERFAGVLSYFPEPGEYALGPEEYLEHIHRVKSAVKIPIVGSLNGSTAETWLKFATSIEQAGVNALELNMYEVVTEPNRNAAAVEHDLREIVADLKHELKIPVAGKLSPFFTAFANVAGEFERGGADGLGHPSTRALVLHRHARGAPAVDGIAGVRPLERRERAAQPREDGGAECVRTGAKHSHAERLELLAGLSGLPADSQGRGL